MSPFVHLIADYGESDPAFSEVVHRLTYHERDIDVQTTEVPPFSTVATGFWIEQLGLHNSAFDDLLVYSNTAPRTEESTPARPDEGGRLCYLELDNGVPVVAVDAGYNLAFVRDHVREFRVIETDHSGGQFRSRDTFPEYVVDLATGNREDLGASLSSEEIPKKPDKTVCHVDGYGNIKTSITASALPPTGDAVSVTINATTQEVAVGDGVAGVEEGTIGLIPGSAGGADPYAELFLRGGAAAAFGHPSPGDDVTVQP
jgi:S-adenosylmethionine hydrolase